MTRCPTLPIIALLLVQLTDASRWALLQRESSSSVIGNGVQQYDNNRTLAALEYMRLLRAGSSSNEVSQDDDDTIASTIVEEYFARLSSSN